MEEADFSFEAVSEVIPLIAYGQKKIDTRSGQKYDAVKPKSTVKFYDRENPEKWVLTEIKNVAKYPSFACVAYDTFPVTVGIMLLEEGRKELEANKQLLPNTSIDECLNKGLEIVYPDGGFESLLQWYEDIGFGYKIRDQQGIYAWRLKVLEHSLDESALKI